MKVGLEKSYPIPGTPDVVWSFLQNIEGVARCMPGARITERLDEKHFKGTVAVKVGPASMSFKGDIEVRELDEAQRMLRLIGKGSDSSGTSGASMDLTARVETGATAGSSNLIGKSDVSMSGKAAAFGGRMMATVADQILNQFAANFAKQISAVAAQAATAPTNAAPPTAQTPGTAHTPPGNAAVGSPDTTAAGAETAPSVAREWSPTSEPARRPSGLSVAVTADELPDKPANEINALALLWAIIRDWFRGLFRRKPA